MATEPETEYGVVDEAVGPPEHRDEIGRGRVRRGDRDLVRGVAKNTDDFRDPDALHMAVLGSRYGHARLEDVDVAGALGAPGVVDAFSADDVADSPIKSTIPVSSSLFGLDDPDRPAEVLKPLTVPDRPLLATGRVRYVGEPIAIVVAEDRYTAYDALELIDVAYERLDAVTHPERAIEGDAPTIHDGTPNNVAFDLDVGDADATQAVFEAADHVVSMDLTHQRVVPSSLEPRTAFAEFEPSSRELTVRVGTQTPHRFQQLLSNLLNLPDNQVQVIAPTVGGGFGCKSKWYAEEPLTAWCSMRTGQPVKWQATRREAQQRDVHGRARTVRGELAVDEDGSMRGLRLTSYADVGAYVSRGAPGSRTSAFVSVLPGQYGIPAVHCRIVGAFTNGSPVDAYRGSSAPQGILVLERLVHLAARTLDLDPAILRRRNFLPPDAFPYETPVGRVFDSGEYADVLDAALEAADYEALRRRQERLREEGRYLGIGLSSSVDNAGSSSPESARVRFHPSGRVTGFCGTADQGQGHRTAFAQLLSDVLGVPFDDIQVREGDTGDLASGRGTGGSRSIVCGGEALRAAAEAVINEARQVAAAHLKVSPASVEFQDGWFSVATDSGKRVHIQEVARRTYAGSGLPEGVDPVLEETAARAGGKTVPSGTHVAIVEVDPETGEMDIERYVAVDDCGVAINPTLVEGQIVGGVVQGIGQALLETAVYDDGGTLLTASFQDYALPRATNVPDVETHHTVTPAPGNPLGVKGVGETGTTAAPAAIANAVVDALAPLGVEHLDLPITPESVWRAVEDHRST